jgi:hypothetical protein
MPDESRPHTLTRINIIRHLVTALLNYFYLHIFKSKFACICQHELQEAEDNTHSISQDIRTKITDTLQKT